MRLGTMSSAPFFYSFEYRSAFLANMAGRLRDTISEDCQILLREKSVVTPITDVSLVLYLSMHDMSSIAEIARALNYSHQRTASRINALEKLAILSRHDDMEDTRCKRFCLTELGKKDLEVLESVYRSASAAMDELFKELDNDLMETMLSAVTSLERIPLSERILLSEQIRTQEEL